MKAGAVLLTVAALFATVAFAVDRDTQHRRSAQALHAVTAAEDDAEAGADAAVEADTETRARVFPNCATHLPTRNEFTAALPLLHRTRHPEYAQIRKLLPNAPAGAGNATPAIWIASAYHIRQIANAFAARTAAMNIPTAVQNAYVDVRSCAMVFLTHHITATIDPIMTGGNPETLLTTYRTVIDALYAPAIDTGAYPAVNSFLYQAGTGIAPLGYLAPCVGVACIAAGTSTRHEGSVLNVRVVQTHAAAAGGGGGPHSPFRWGFWDTKIASNAITTALSALPFVLYTTANPPAQVPAHPVAAQYLSYATRECHVMQLDAGEADNVFTTEMSGCNAYVLREATDAAEPIFIHCNGNLITSNAYASVPDKTPGCAGEMAKTMTAELIFAKYARYGFVRHVSHRRFPHYGPNPHAGGHIVAADPQSGGVATWGHRTGVHTYDWFASYIGGAGLRPKVWGGQSWVYEEQPMPLFKHIQLLPAAGGGGNAPDHAWPEMPNPFGAFHCHERVPSQAEYNAVCGAHCSAYARSKLPLVAPAPMAWWQPPVGMIAGVAPAGGWGVLVAPTALENTRLQQLMVFLHQGLTSTIPHALPWAEAKMRLHDQLRHCVAMLITTAQNG